MSYVGVSEEELGWPAYCSSIVFLQLMSRKEASQSLRSGEL